jgi:hypothetical protein
MSSRQIIKRFSVPEQRPTPFRREENTLSRVFIPEGNNVPVVECTKSGDVITQIDIRCSCGQVTRIVCEYADEIRLAK